MRNKKRMKRMIRKTVRGVSRFLIALSTNFGALLALLEGIEMRDKGYTGEYVLLLLIMLGCVCSAYIVLAYDRRDENDR